MMAQSDEMKICKMAQGFEFCLGRQRNTSAPTKCGPFRPLMDSQIRNTGSISLQSDIQDLDALVL